jgi:hypothetical protein
VSKGTYSIKDFDDREGLILSHPQKRIISVPKHVAELLDVILRVCVEVR